MSAMFLLTFLILNLRSAVKSEEQIGSPCKKACVIVSYCEVHSHAIPQRLTKYLKPKMF